VARRPGLLSPSVFIRRSGFYKGVLGGSKGWLAVFALFWGSRKLKTTFGRSEEVAATEVLKPGEFVTIRAITPPKRRERKAAKAAAKRAS
jgi:hypothetical protein